MEHFKEQVQQNAKNRIESKELKIINDRNYINSFLNYPVEYITRGYILELTLPYYSYYPIHLSDLVSLYRYIANLNPPDEYETTYSKSLSNILKEISQWTTRIAENERIKQLMYDFEEVNVNDEVIDPDFITDFPYDMSERGDYSVVRDFDNIIDEEGYANVLNNTEAADIEIEALYK